MSFAASQTLSLEQFLQLPNIEASPAWEYLQGEAIQKPMPGGKHSRLQAQLAATINAQVTAYVALPELRCTFAERSIVPDLVVIPVEQIPTDAAGEIVEAGITFAPDWLIEILSPDQSQMRVTRKILHSLRYGSQMGWLIDPSERVVLVYQPDHLPTEYIGSDPIPSLKGTALNLTVDQLFSWLVLTSR
jgi:Uma2 family endonuclease